MTHSDPRGWVKCRLCGKRYSGVVIDEHRRTAHPCPGHPIMVQTGPNEDDFDPDYDFCDGSCVTLAKVLRQAIDAERRRDCRHSDRYACYCTVARDEHLDTLTALLQLLDTYPCICGPEYSERGLTAPECDDRHDLADDLEAVVGTALRKMGAIR